MVPGLLPAVVAALLWGGYLYSLKRHFSGYSGAVVALVVNTLATAWYLPGAYAYLGGFPAFPSLSAVGLGTVVVTVALAAAGFLTVTYALAAGDVSLVAPVAKIVPVFVLPLEILLLGAAFGPLQVLGIAVVTAAVYVANYEGGHVLDPLRNLTRSRAVQLALLSAACYGVSDVAKRVVLQDVGLPGAYWVIVSLLGPALLLAPVAIRRWPREGVRDDLPKFVGIAVVVALARVATTLSFSVTSASVAATVINAQAVVAVVLGGVFLAEEGFRTRLAASALA
ncbi:EamA family transporter, partial [Halarchaeum acidiphilum]